MDAFEALTARLPEFTVPRSDDRALPPFAAGVDRGHHIAVEHYARAAMARRA